jgi:hypothetical protein
LPSKRNSKMNGSKRIGDSFTTRHFSNGEIFN